VAAVVNTICISLLIMSVFWKIGKFPELYKYPFTEEGIEEANAAYAQYLVNLAGLAFMISNMMSVSASINLILMVPLQAPVMQRELANKLYTPTAYFIGSFLSNIIM